MDDSHQNSSEMADLEPAERARLIKLGKLVTNHFTKHRALLPDPAKVKAPEKKGNSHRLALHERRRKAMGPGRTPQLR
ncbi:unnamed protein product [Zymoseptoria tritici ST99CH_1A5]|uniref:Uncharacterized protein n=1 Tax=Zymoseptoria tritici ST99CH_1A5 TaxID=1276529 RepID=A0A1Y6LR02_ZYMTR|nr:unnamed protein product [Zymoseptoria tritici ST99CH_1A5]